MKVLKTEVKQDLSHDCESETNEFMNTDHSLNINDDQNHLSGYHPDNIDRDRSFRVTSSKDGFTSFIESIDARKVRARRRTFFG